MRRALALAAGILAVVIAAPAYANAWGEGVEVIEDASLADLRGGFAVNGVEIGFGATISTYADGVLALTTQLTWSDNGAVIEQTLGSLGQAVDALTPEQRSAMGLDGVTGGVVIADDTGVTTLIHNVTNGALQNIILNTASGRRLTQDIDVTLTLPGFESVQKDMGFEIFGMRLNDDLTHMMATNPGAGP
ncbi:MAG TPA: hypothetical protein VG841_10705 [Caulobacterales bacterium]|nr:hypothetical protein [Caulobacterales bacterium]